jgi:DNA-binding protein H-NS
VTLIKRGAKRKSCEMRMTNKNKLNLDALSVDEMWQLHEEISRVLSVRLTSEKRELEKRLAQLRREKDMRESEAAEARPLKNAAPARRKYPRVFPKYRNPQEPSETWSGRGKQPRWLAAALKTGHTIEEFAIGAESKKNTVRRGRA